MSTRTVPCGRRTSKQRSCLVYRRQQQFLTGLNDLNGRLGAFPSCCLGFTAAIGNTIRWRSSYDLGVGPSCSAFGEPSAISSTEKTNRYGQSKLRCFASCPPANNRMEPTQPTEEGLDFRFRFSNRIRDREPVRQSAKRVGTEAEVRAAACREYLIVGTISTDP